MERPSCLAAREPEPADDPGDGSSLGPSGGVEGTAVETALIAAFRATARLPLRVEMDAAAAQQAIEDDVAIATALKPDDSLLRVWRNRRCLVASNRQARVPGFAAARATVEATGWPVAIRRSGGRAVIHRPGILNVSLLARDAGAAAPCDYGPLLAIVEDALAALGIGSEAGAVTGAACDGRHNLCWRGRKLAGTAGCVLNRDGAVLRLFHASVHVHGPVEPDLALIHAFEAALGEPLAYLPAKHVSVRDILAGRAPG